MKHTLNNFWQRIKKAIEITALKKAQEELFKYSTYRETYTELNRLSDRELMDIGLTRNDIHDMALNAFFKKKASQHEKISA